MRALLGANTTILEEAAGETPSRWLPNRQQDAEAEEEAQLQPAHVRRVCLLTRRRPLAAHTEGEMCFLRCSVIFTMKCGLLLIKG